MSQSDESIVEAYRKEMPLLTQLATENYPQPFKNILTNQFQVTLAMANLIVELQKILSLHTLQLQKLESMMIGSTAGPQDMEKAIMAAHSGVGTGYTTPIMNQSSQLDQVIINQSPAENQSKCAHEAREILYVPMNIGFRQKYYLCLTCHALLYLDRTLVPAAVQSV